jgi:hypothetical protein
MSKQTISIDVDVPSGWQLTGVWRQPVTEESHG